MPSQAAHEAIDKVIFGKPYPEIHRVKDAPYYQLGMFHRFLNHDIFYDLNSSEPAVEIVHDIVDIATLPFLPIGLILCPKVVVDDF